jgi:hypothetical protein
MPAVLEALAVTVTVPETVVPPVGAVTETVGGGVVLALFTLTETAALVALFPTVLVATAVIVWLPFDSKVVFSTVVYGRAIKLGPLLAPSTLNCTLDTETILSEAFAVRFTDPASVAPAAGETIETVGGVVSFSVENDRSPLVALLPFASVERTRKW